MNSNSSGRERHSDSHDLRAAIDNTKTIGNSLDIVIGQEATKTTDATVPGSALPQKRMKVLFACCHSYTFVTVPPQVRSGEWENWRLHCPRCGALQLVEVG